MNGWSRDGLRAHDRWLEILGTQGKSTVSSQPLRRATCTANSWQNNSLQKIVKRLLEQRYVIKFCVNLGKTNKETHDIIKEVYDDAAMAKSGVFE